MKVVWANEPPITANTIMKQHGNNEGWKVQTAISLLLRLVERGFLRTEKNGKERTYFPTIEKEDYLKFEMNNFLKQFCDNSILNLVANFCDDETLTDDELEKLLSLTTKLKERRG